MLKTLLLACLLSAGAFAEKHAAPAASPVQHEQKRRARVNYPYRFLAPSPFLGLSWGGLIGNVLGNAIAGAVANRGERSLFDDETSAAGPMRYSSTADYAQTADGELPPDVTVYRVAAIEQQLPEAPAPTFAPWEVIAVDGGMMDSNGSVCHYAWKVVIRNNTDTKAAFAGSVDFLDQDGRAVDSSRVAGLDVAPHSGQTFTGSKMMMADSAQAIAKTKVHISPTP